MPIGRKSAKKIKLPKIDTERLGQLLLARMQEHSRQIREIQNRSTEEMTAVLRREYEEAQRRRQEQQLVYARTISDQQDPRIHIREESESDEWWHTEDGANYFQRRIAEIEAERLELFNENSLLKEQNTNILRMLSQIRVKLECGEDVTDFIRTIDRMFKIDMGQFDILL